MWKPFRSMGWLKKYIEIYKTISATALHLNKFWVFFYTLVLLYTCKLKKTCSANLYSDIENTFPEQA